MASAGTWKDSTGNVNAMATNLTGQVRNIAEVTAAGQIEETYREDAVDAQGRSSRAAKIPSTHWSVGSKSFASEVTCVAVEVGTEGKLGGGKARVSRVGGALERLTGNVYLMAENPTDRVRNITRIATAVALGGLSRRAHGRRDG